MSETTRTVRVRIAVAVDAGGDYEAAGWGYASGTVRADDSAMAEKAADMLGESTYSPGVRITYVEADVPVPVRTTVEGEVCDE